MSALIQRIRSGEVDLTPNPKTSGWYDYQIHALETMLLAQRGAEHEKLLLTRSYKNRMLEAFQSLITKRRETHIRGAKITASAMPPSLLESEFVPRLRVEPCPSYFLRTARAYDFLANLLQTTFGESALRSLHGLRESGERSLDLFAELTWTRNLFRGLYYLSAEDIGLKPEVLVAGDAERADCERIAAEWIGHVFDDPDLKADTRVSVPIFVDPDRRIVRIWATLGVRLAKLETKYASPPRVKPIHSSEDWEPLKKFYLGEKTYLIPVDEFAEVELKGMRVLDRSGLRSICDANKTKEAIVSALKQ